MDSGFFEPLWPQLPAITGSAIACAWMRGTWPRKLTLVVGGAVASHFLAPLVPDAWGVPSGSAGFLIGLLSMAAADVAFRSLQVLAIGEVVNDWLRKVLRLPPRHSDKGGVQ